MLRTSAAPGRLFIERSLCELAQRVNRFAVSHHCVRGQQRARGLIHKGHELIREARHRAAYTDSADVRASPHAVDPTTLSYVALNDRPPASELHDTLPRSVFFGELSL